MRARRILYTSHTTYVRMEKGSGENFDLLHRKSCFLPFPFYTLCNTRKYVWLARLYCTTQTTLFIIDTENLARLYVTSKAWNCVGELGLWNFQCVQSADWVAHRMHTYRATLISTRPWRWAISLAKVSTTRVQTGSIYTMYEINILPGICVSIGVTLSSSSPIFLVWQHPSQTAVRSRPLSYQSLTNRSKPFMVS